MRGIPIGLATSFSGGSKDIKDNLTYKEVP